MMFLNNIEKILIMFGSQFTQLIARKIRELGVYSEIVSHRKINLNALSKLKYICIILSYGPFVYESSKYKFDKKILKISVPFLGISFGHQILAKELEEKLNNLNIGNLV